MKETYTVRYRQPGQWLWRKVRNVKGDGIEAGIRFFHCEDDSLHYCSVNAEVVFPPERQAIITHKMSREAGTPIQRA